MKRRKGKMTTKVLLWWQRMSLISQELLLKDSSSPPFPAMCLTIVCSLGPPCGPVNCNEKIVSLLQRLKPEIKDVIEQLKLVSSPTATPRL